MGRRKRSSIGITKDDTFWLFHVISCYFKQKWKMGRNMAFADHLQIICRSFAADIPEIAVKKSGAISHCIHIGGNHWIATSPGDPDSLGVFNI